MKTINQFCKENCIDVKSFKEFLLKPHYDEMAKKVWSNWNKYIPIHKNSTLNKINYLFANYDAKGHLFTFREIDLLLS